MYSVFVLQCCRVILYFVMCQLGLSYIVSQIKQHQFIVFNPLFYSKILKLLMCPYNISVIFIFAVEMSSNVSSYHRCTVGSNISNCSILHKQTLSKTCSTFLNVVFKGLCYGLRKNFLALQVILYICAAQFDSSL